MSPPPLEGSGSVGARKKAPDYLAGGLLATWLEPKNSHTGEESDGDHKVAKHEEYKTRGSGGQTRPSHCRRFWYSPDAVSRNMTDCTRGRGITLGLSPLPLQNQPDGRSDKLVGLPDSVDQKAPVRDRYTARIADEEHKGGGRPGCLRGIVKMDRPSPMRGRGMLMDCLSDERVDLGGRHAV